MLIIFMINGQPKAFCERYRDIVPTDAEIEIIDKFYNEDVNADLCLVVQDKDLAESQGFLDDLFRKRGIAVIDGTESAKHRLSATPEVVVDPNVTSASDLWDLLVLIGHPVPINRIREWPDDFRAGILAWASATHLATSGHAVTVPPEPVLPRDAFKGDLNTESVRGTGK